MDNLLVLIGLRIRDLRKEQGYTQETLSEKADINYSYLAGIERGERNPTISHFIKIADSLGVSLYKLFLIESQSDLTNDETIMLHELKTIFDKIDTSDRTLALNILQQIADRNESTK